MTTAYLFLNYNCIWAYEISFPDRWEQLPQPAIAYSKLTIETLEQGVKYV